MQPQLSIVIPCYNEEAIVKHTIHKLVAAFDSLAWPLEVIPVDNGSVDHTGEILKALAESDSRILPHRVDVNQGYGYGVLRGIAQCHGTWVCIIPADGQVDPEDVVRLCEAIESATGNILGKVRRRFRMDGMLRKLVSTSYNVGVRLLWPGIASWDINGSPKVLRRDHLEAMQLESKGWFLDPEIMIKAHMMGLTVLEFSVFSRMRGSGMSHVQPSTCTEFLANLLRYRFSRKLRNWKPDLGKSVDGKQNADELDTVK
jgi:glycosyltransferase involved in cell wall biosynthesis